MTSGEATTIGVSAESSNGAYRFSGGTEPGALALAVLVAYVYFLLMNAQPSVGTKPLHRRFRRLVAFWLDFVLAMSIFAPIIGVVPMVAEWSRTGVFAWAFERETSAAGDLVLILLSAFLISAGLLLFYMIPILRRRPSPGACIAGYQVVPDGDGVLTMRQVLSLGFIASCCAWIAPFRGGDRKRGQIWFGKTYRMRATLLDEI